MRKLIVSILIVLTSVSVGFWAIGAIANENYSGQISSKLNASPERVWSVLSRFTEFQKERREIIRIDILESDSLGPIKWKEFTDMDGFIVFERIEWVPNERLKLKMESSSFGMTGVWTYQIDPLDYRCRLTISEESTVQQSIVRSALVIAGRDANLKQEMNLISSTLAE